MNVLLEQLKYYRYEVDIEIRPSVRGIYITLDKISFTACWSVDVEEFKNGESRSGKAETGSDHGYSLGNGLPDSFLRGCVLQE